MQAQEDQAQSALRFRIPFRADIEGLRALAIILVVVSHIGLPFFSSGFIGVDVFFVLSGYLITSLLIKEIDSTGRLDLARFYARRARRLLPAAILLVVVVCIIEAIIVSPIVQFRILKAAVATIFYSSNFYFARVGLRDGLRYFEQESAVSPLLHTWSLAVEEQFYLAWPVVLLLLSKAGRSRKAVMIALIAMATASFAFCVWQTSINPIGAFFEPFSRVWEFCAGGLIACLPAALFTQHRRLSSWMGAIGIFALLACAQLIRESEFPGYVALIPVLGTVAVLLAGSGAPDSLIPRILSTRPAQALGGLSYSLYLWHWPALVIGQQLFPSGAAIVRLASIGVAILLAVLTHRTVEYPLRFNPRLVSKSSLTLKLALLSAILCTCGLAGWRLILLHSNQFHKFDRAAKDLPGLYIVGCGPERPDPKPRLCYFGATHNPRSTVVLLGDSHAAQWFPALQQISEAQNWKLVTIVKPGCSALMTKEDASPQFADVCAEWRRLAIDNIQQLHPDLVVVASTSMHAAPNRRLLTDLAVWQQAAHDTFSVLAQTGAAVRFIRDTPHAKYNALECLAQAEWDGRTQCAPVRPAEALFPDIYAAEVRGAAGLENVSFIDLSDALCGADQCPLEIDGMVVYRDYDHLTATFDRSLAELLFRRLDDSLRR
jgi:peptidoglycan/LPS O-acetylase OafA/YrhL